MNKHLANILITITEITVENHQITVSWSQLPFSHPRSTTYTIEEVIQWLADDPVDGIGVNPDFFQEEFELMIKDAICDFHEAHTNAPFQQEIDFLLSRIKNLLAENSRFTKIIDALQRRIIKQNRVPNQKTV